MSFEVRAATGDEADAVLAMYEWLFDPPGGAPPDWDPGRARAAVVEAIDGDGSAILVADDSGELIGLCSTYLDLNSVRYGLRCWVEDLAVDPNRRSEGIGAALLAASRDWGAAQGATHLELDSGEARKEAHRFYDREGPSWRGLQYSWWFGA